MKEKITGIISFLGAVGWGILGVFIFVEAGLNNDTIYLPPLFITSVSIILYVIWTRFGKQEFSELKKIDLENQILKRQIEQKELKKKLDE